jgi:hypothetical protein
VVKPTTGLTQDGALDMQDGRDSRHPPVPSGNTRQDLAAVEAEHPGWHAWEGVISGVLYARRTKSSPPRVVRATSAVALAAAIEADEREAGER